MDLVNHPPFTFWINIISVIAFVISMIAFLLAIYQTQLALKQTREARESTKEVQLQLCQLDEIRQGLSTQFLGRFPDYFRKVADLVEQAERDIFILVPFPSVGCFTSPDSFIRYKQAIERKTIKAEGVAVYMTCQTHEQRLLRCKEQFNKEGPEWEDWKRENVRMIESFLFTYGQGTSIEKLSRDDFVKMLEIIDQQLIPREFAKTDYAETELDIPIYLWIIDEKIAVFAIASVTEAHYSFGFMTTDQKLITAFKDVSIRYHGERT